VKSSENISPVTEQYGAAEGCYSLRAARSSTAIGVQVPELSLAFDEAADVAGTRLPEEDQHRCPKKTSTAPTMFNAIVMVSLSGYLDSLLHTTA
jgi:hypothetical protein